MRGLGGIRKKSRQQLAKLLARTNGVIGMSDVVEQLEVTPEKGRKLLASWHQRGWLRRLERGVYVPVPMDAEEPDLPFEEPWLLASHLFSPFFISGWSAAQYWGFTDQIFETTVVITAKPVAKRERRVGSVRFLLKWMAESRHFGTVTEWIGGNRIAVADPTRTILDMFNDPRLAGGIRHAVDCFEAYVQSEHCDFDQLINYAAKLANGTVFKRLGFIAERICPDRNDFLLACSRRLSAGYSQLDPSLKGEKIVTRWRLKMPANLKEWQ